MPKAKVSKQAIRKLMNAPIEVKLWNGNFHRATVESVFSRYTITLEVEVYRDELRLFHGKEPGYKAKLVKWVNSRGSSVDIPPELSSLVLQMKEIATVSNDDLTKLIESNYKACLEFQREMGFS